MSEADAAPLRLLLGATVEATVRHFMLDQAEYLQAEGLDVHIFCSGCACETPGADSPGSATKVQLYDIDMRRDVSVVHDVRSLRAIHRLVKELSPDVLMVGTPKAGLLAMLAGALAGVSVRIYVVRGLRLEGLTGLAALISRLTERVACHLATHVLCVSPSLGDELIARRITDRQRVVVLGAGGSNGVRTEHFRPPTALERDLARRMARVPTEARVVGFAGRLTPDKGVDDLTAAVRAAHTLNPNVHLLIAGAADTVHPLPVQSELALAEPWCTRLGQLEDMRAFYWALDAFCLPSLREGMPNVNLEAAACGLPVITTRATGCRDSVVDGVTGFVVGVHEPDQLARTLSMILGNAHLSAAIGEAGRQRVVDDFDQRRVWARTLSFIREAGGR